MKLFIQVSMQMTNKTTKHFNIIHKAHKCMKQIKRMQTGLIVTLSYSFQLDPDGRLMQLWTSALTAANQMSDSLNSIFLSDS